MNLVIILRAGFLIREIAGVKEKLIQLASQSL